MLNEKVICISEVKTNSLPGVKGIALHEILTVKDINTHVYPAFEFYEKQHDNGMVVVYNVRFFVPLDEFLKSDEFSIEELLEQQLVTT